MPTLTVRNLDENLKSRLRVRAAEHGRSMEAEAREILREALTPRQARDLGAQIHERLAGLGLDELEIPPRTERARAADFDQ